jgi:uncharacterized protein YoxC
MNLTNIVGKNTQDYINSLKGKQSMKKLTLPKTEATIETETATETVKKVTRTINGKKVTLTPMQNFVKEAAYRLDMLKAQFDQLGKKVGSNYEHTDQQLDYIETQILEMASVCLDKLRNPKKAKRQASGFEAALRKV